MDPAVTSNRFLEQKVKDNFKVMEAAGASFELLLDMSQYQQAADVLDTVPNLVVIINHRGMPPTVEQFESKQYWDAMKRFAAMETTASIGLTAEEMEKKRKERMERFG